MARLFVRDVAGPRRPGFRRFWLAVLISSLGTWAAVIALSLRMYDRTGSEGWVAALFVAEFVPPVLLSLLAAPLLDRLPPRRTLVAADLVRAVAFGVLAFVEDPATVVALVCVTGFATGVFAPVSLAVVPRLVPDDELDRANGALGAADNVTTLFGTGLGGVAVAAVGAGTLLLGNATSFVLSAVLLLGVRSLARAEPVRREEQRFRLRLRAGLETVRHSPTLRVVAVAWGIVGLAVGVHNALLVPLLRGTLDAGPDVVGIVSAAAALGLVLGTVAGARILATRVAPYPAVLAVLGLGMALTGLAPVAAVAAIPLVLMGAANGVAIVHNRSGVQRAAHPSQRAGVFALLVGSSSLAIAAGAALAAPLAAVVSTAGAFVVAGALVGLVAVPLSVVLARAGAAPPHALAGAPDGFAASPPASRTP